MQSEGPLEHSQSVNVSRQPDSVEAIHPMLEAAVDRLRQAADGERNDELNRISFAAGRLVERLDLDEGGIETELLYVATELGLPEEEAVATIQSGLKAGKEASTDDPFTSPKGLAYLVKRGIKDRLLIEQAVLSTSDSYLVFPWLNAAGESVYRTRRLMGDGTPKYINDAGSVPALWASPGAWSSTTVVLVEGYIDALAAAQAGTPAFATGTSSISGEALPLLAGRRVILVRDVDEAGKKWRAKCVALLGARCELFEATVPEGCKDLAEVAEKSDDPVGAVKAILAAATPIDPASLEANATSSLRNSSPLSLVRGVSVQGAVQDSLEAGVEAASVRPWPLLDVSTGREVGGEEESKAFVVEHLLAIGSILLIAAEEGKGKTLLADQFCRQLLRREPVFGFFPVGEAAPSSVLFFDGEMGRHEAIRRARDAEQRGMEVQPGTYNWIQPGRIDLSVPFNQRMAEDAIERSRATFLWFDSASSLVGDPSDDRAVFDFVGWVRKLIENNGVLGAGISAHFRKSPSKGYGHNFDDIFGSRQWKGLPDSVLMMTTNGIRVFKQRGEYLRKVFGIPEGKGNDPQMRLLTPGYDDDYSVPFEVVAQPLGSSTKKTVEELKQLAIEIVSEHPDEYGKSALATLLGGRKEDALDVINELLKEGILGPDKARAKLKVVMPLDD